MFHSLGYDGSSGAWMSEICRDPVVVRCREGSSTDGENRSCASQFFDDRSTESAAGTEYEYASTLEFRHDIDRTGRVTTVTAAGRFLTVEICEAIFIVSLSNVVVVCVCGGALYLIPLRAKPAMKYRWNTRNTTAIGTTLIRAKAIVAP